MFACLLVRLFACLLVRLFACLLVRLFANMLVYCVVWKNVSSYSNSHEFELHRPSNKGTKLLLKVIKAIIIICFINTCASFACACVLSGCTCWCEYAGVLCGLTDVSSYCYAFKLLIFVDSLIWWLIELLDDFRFVDPMRRKQLLDFVPDKWRSLVFVWKICIPFCIRSCLLQGWSWLVTCR